VFFAANVLCGTDNCWLGSGYAHVRLPHLEARLTKRFGPTHTRQAKRFDGPSTKYKIASGIPLLSWFHDQINRVKAIQIDILLHLGVDSSLHNHAAIGETVAANGPRHPD